MTYDDLQNEIQALVKRTKEEYFRLIRSYVVEHNSHKEGDLMTLNGETLKLSRITISAPITVQPHLSTVIYHGPRYTKAGVPAKRGGEITHSTCVARDSTLL